MSIINTMKRLANKWADSGEDEPVSQSPLNSERPADRWAILESVIELSAERREKYKDYEIMDREIDELSSSLDLYADFIVSGGEDSESVYSIDAEKTDAPTGDAIERLEKKLNLKNRIWFLARNVAKYGDAFYEVVVDQNEVVKLVNMPPASMEVNRDPQTKLIDPDFPYIQKLMSGALKPIEFAPWEIVHFKAGEGDYGVDFSILGKCRRSSKIVRMIEDAVLVARLTRANNRLVYTVDVSNMGVNEGLKYLEKLKEMYRTRRYTDATGKLKVELNPLQPQEDIWLPQRKDKSTTVQPISGDVLSMRGLADVEHFHNKLFAATKVPKAYLGFEQDTSGRATLTQQHLSFSKSVRRFRHVLSTGLRHIYKVEFLMLGIDPQSFDWKLKFPGLGSADEEMKWTIENMKANLVNTYTNSGLSLPIEWIVRHLFLNLTPAEEEELIGLLKSAETQMTTPQMPGLNPGGKQASTFAQGHQVNKMTAGATTGGPSRQLPSSKGNGNGKLSDNQYEAVLELFKQDAELMDGYRKFMEIRRTGKSSEYY